MLGQAGSLTGEPDRGRIHTAKHRRQPTATTTGAWTVGWCSHDCLHHQLPGIADAALCAAMTDSPV
jgi:hypothetical protein